MAGFFGLVNYEKEGPGVSKDAPKKKGFIRFFEIYFNYFWKLITINFFYDLLCIPVLTSGLASVGMTNVTRNISRGQYSFGTSDFFETVKKNWKQGLFIGIANLVITALLGFDIYYFFHVKGTLGAVFTGISLFLFFTFTIMKYYMPLLIITFSLKPRQLYKNSFRFVFLNLPKNLLIFFVLLVIEAAMALITFYGGSIGAAIMSVLFICIFPAFRSYLIQFNIFGAVRKFMIDPYYEEHPEADIEKRLALGLEVADEYMPKYDDDDTVFSDAQIIKDKE